MITVKPLDWEVDEPEWHVAKTVFNFGYEVRRTDRGGIRFRYGNRSFETFDGTFEEAKAHCQADYEARIISALTNTDEAPVGYCVWINGKLSGCAKSHCGSFPVYARPQSAAVRDEVETLRDALKNLLGVYDTPLSRRRFPQDDFMKEAIETARAALHSTQEG
jgi:hypothetical protein